MQHRSLHIGGWNDRAACYSDCWLVEHIILSNTTSNGNSTIRTNQEDIIGKADKSNPFVPEKPVDNNGWSASTRRVYARLGSSIGTARYFFLQACRLN